MFSRIFFLTVIINSLWGINYDLLNKYKSNQSDRELGFSTIIGIMVDFEYEEINDPNTTGNGQFLNEIDPDLIASRCDGFLVDPPPHNAEYFRDQIQAVKNYFNSNINQEEDIFDFYVLDEVLHLSKPMRDYSVSDNTIGDLFSESIDLAYNEGNLSNQEWYDDSQLDSYLFVVFHAGVGQDISFPYLDPTNYDIPSAYIDSSMLEESWEYYDVIQNGLVLPETLNHIYYNIIEDLFYGNDNFCNYQLGMTGLFSLLVGYAMGLPPLYNTDNGAPGIGSFGLMDYGSNNGFGVIPAPISPWSKIYKNWASSETIDFGSINIDTEHINRIDISDSEYLLIENKNNWIEEDIDLDSLRNKYKVWSPSLQDSIPGYFFDVLTNRLDPGQINISEATNVILGVDNYNYGLPGSGLLIWSVNEDLINDLDFSLGINNDPSNKAIEIKEADGARDIGQDCYHWNPSFCDLLNKGWRYDFWYHENGQYFINNPEQSNIKINDDTNPDLRSDLGGLSLIEISQISDAGNSMQFDYSSYTPSLSVSYVLPNSNIDIIGAGVLDQSGCLYYLENEIAYQRCYGSQISSVDDFVNTDHTKILVYNNNLYMASDNQYIDSSVEEPSLLDGLDELGLWGYFNSITNLNESNIGISAGDLDNDGLDEYVSILNNSIYAYNSNNTTVDGFPVDLPFEVYDETILISNILNDEKPEIILKSEGSIYILNSIGEVVTSIASASHNRLRLLPWGDNIALIDGNRLFLFPYDEEHTYWTSQYSTDWDFPMVSPNTFPREINYMSSDIVFYNYPNPVKNNITTFRFLNQTGNMNPKIKIYNIEGLLIDTIYPNDNFQNLINEYSEISNDFSDYQNGVYFAELKDGNKSISIIKVAIIK